MAFDPALLKINQIAREWAKKRPPELRQSLASNNIGVSGELRKSLRQRVYYYYGVADRIGFKLKRYGIFRAKGVGRGRPIGSAAANQFAKPWFNPVIDEHLPELADELSQAAADLTLKTINLK